MTTQQVKFQSVKDKQAPILEVNVQDDQKVEFEKDGVLLAVMVPLPFSSFHQIDQIWCGVVESYKGNNPEYSSCVGAKGDVSLWVMRQLADMLPQVNPLA